MAKERSAEVREVCGVSEARADGMRDTSVAERKVQVSITEKRSTASGRFRLANAEYEGKNSAALLTER
jgi:hypothetical protein